MKAPQNNSNNSYFMIPEGKHLAVLTEIIDLGTHEAETQYGVKLQRKVRINWELPRVLHEFKEGEGEKPAYIGRMYTFSMYKSNLLDTVESILGKKLGEGEADDFDFSTILGSTCEIKVAHSTGKDGKTYANIFKIYDTETTLESITPLTIFSLDDYDQSQFHGLRDWMKEMIEKSPEYQKVRDGGSFTERLDTNKEDKIEEDFDDLIF